jgi:hypothetical protein
MIPGSDELWSDDLLILCSLDLMTIGSDDLWIVSSPKHDLEVLRSRGLTISRSYDLEVLRSPDLMISGSHDL